MDVDYTTKDRQKARSTAKLLIKSLKNCMTEKEAESLIETELLKMADFKAESKDKEFEDLINSFPKAIKEIIKEKYLKTFNYDTVYKQRYVSSGN